MEGRPGMGSNCGEEEKEEVEDFAERLVLLVGRVDGSFCLFLLRLEGYPDQ